MKNIRGKHEPDNDIRTELVVMKSEGGIINFDKFFK